jgi:FkbM family methyltransferase
MMRLLKLFILVMPNSWPEFIYTRLFFLKPLKKIANSLICLAIPPVKNFREFDLILNQEDSVVSGAIALDIYEPYEIDLFTKTVKHDSVIFDLGAHIGYFSILGASLAKKGLVYSFEPDKKNFSYLKKSIALNDFKNIKIFNFAAADKEKQVELFLSDDNSGDHRIYNVSGRNKIKNVPAIDLDSFAKKNDIKKVDVIKMDIQGAEFLALQGMEKIIQSNPHLIIFTEFWPSGLKACGSNPLTFLKSLRRYGFNIFEINERTKTLNEVFNFDQLNLKFKTKMGHTNLLCRK